MIMELIAEVLLEYLYDVPGTDLSADDLVVLSTCGDDFRIVQVFKELHEAA